MRHPEYVPNIPVSHTVVTASGATFRRVRKIAKNENYLHPHGTTRRPLDRFSWNLIFKDFFENCRENSSSIKIWQELGVLYTKTNFHFWSYLAQFLEWEAFQTECSGKIKTHISYVFFSRKSRHIFHMYFFFFENLAVCETMW